MGKTFKQLLESLNRSAKNAAQDVAAKNRHASLPHTQDVKTIRQYQDGSSFINKGLINGGIDKLQTMTQEIDHNLSHAIKNLSEPTNRDMHVYHGFTPSSQKKTRLNIPSLPKNDDGHHVLKNPAYLSTSLSRTSARGFGTDLLKIHVPKGSKAGIPAHGRYNSEKEVILHKNHELHIHPTPTKVESEQGSYNVWHAKLVHDGTS
jgi:hypothetical protein